GFAGVLVDLTGLETVGISFSGLSSSGKTLLLRLGVSLWSTPDLRDGGLLQSASSTENAIEPKARRASGTILALDELALLAGKTVGKIIYTLAGGVGKGRMNLDFELQKGSAWNTIVLLSSEHSLSEKIRGDGGEFMPGHAVRFTDIDVEGVNRAV